VVLVLSVRDARTDHQPARLFTTTPADDIQDAVTEMTSVSITSAFEVPAMTAPPPRPTPSSK
jgi:hypothetical protein